MLPSFPGIMKTGTASHSETLDSPYHATQRHIREELSTFRLIQYKFPHAVFMIRLNIIIPTMLNCSNWPLPIIFPTVHIQITPHGCYTFFLHFPLSFCRPNLHSEYDYLQQISSKVPVIRQLVSCFTEPSKYVRQV
jgi:hypothetical protein